jgi:hypothetical protein
MSANVKHLDPSLSVDISDIRVKGNARMKASFFASHFSDLKTHGMSLVEVHRSLPGALESMLASGNKLMLALISFCLLKY